MKQSNVLYLLLFVTTNGLAQENNQEQSITQKAQNYCNKTLGKDSHKDALNYCIYRYKSMEKIDVVGRYIGIEIPEVVGRYHLNRDFIENAPRTTGDINDLIALLPGVQTSENASSIENVAEISAQELSISGAQPWQTSFNLDGLNYNNRMDIGQKFRTAATANDVTGGVQTMNLNSVIASSIDIYDSNVPAEFGGFSGGVVDAKSRDAFEQNNTFTFGYRGSDSSWRKYHIIIPTEDNSTELVANEIDEPPVYRKNNYELSLSRLIDNHHGINANFSFLESVISDISLGKMTKSRRENINGQLKYSYRDGWVDKLDLSLIFAPYTSEEYLKDVLNSHYTLDGGSIGSTLNLGHDIAIGYLSVSLAVSKGKNSRRGPPHFYYWAQAKGKNWGITSENETEKAGLLLSLEGGHGNLDNEQSSLNWNSKFILNDIDYLDMTHSLSVGAKANYTTQLRHRLNDNYNYDAPRIYSTKPEELSLDCRGYQLDCIELEYVKPFEEFKAAFEATHGVAFDTANPNHAIALTKNISVTPQYFVTRNIQPSELIEETMRDVSLYFNDRIETNRWDINLGLRTDYDDFFKNTNIAPRFSTGFDLFEDGNTLLVFGANRYYDRGSIQNKLKAQQKFSRIEYRPIIDGALQGWIDVSANHRFKHRFNNLDTPYDDELVYGFKHKQAQWGNFSLKLIKRFKRDQIVQLDAKPIAADGVRYIDRDNGGKGYSDQISFAWDTRLGKHSLWFNTAYNQSYNNLENTNTNVNNSPTDDLVNYDGRIVTRQTLRLINTNFSRPMTYKFGWSYQYSDNLKLNITGNHKSSYETAAQTSIFKASGKLRLDCARCEAVSVSLPYYRKVTRRAVANFALSSTYNYTIATGHNLVWRFDISNLFNSRTYTINENIGRSGIEPGRSFWLGVKYDYR